MQTAGNAETGPDEVQPDQRLGREQRLESVQQQPVGRQGPVRVRVGAREPGSRRAGDAVRRPRRAGRGVPGDGPLGSGTVGRPAGRVVDARRLQTPGAVPAERILQTEQRAGHHPVAELRFHGGRQHGRRRSRPTVLRLFVRPQNVQLIRVAGTDSA